MKLFLFVSSKSPACNALLQKLQGMEIPFEISVKPIDTQASRVRFARAKIPITAVPTLLVYSEKSILQYKGYQPIISVIQNMIRTVQEQHAPEPEPQPSAPPTSPGTYPNAPTQGTSGVTTLDLGFGAETPGDPNEHTEVEYRSRLQQENERRSVSTEKLPPASRPSVSPSPSPSPETSGKVKHYAWSRNLGVEYTIPQGDDIKEIAAQMKSSRPDIVQ